MAFPNMRAELERSAISYQQCADLLGTDLDSFNLKLDEQAPMTVVEAKRIRDVFCAHWITYLKAIAQPYQPSSAIAERE